MQHLSRLRSRSVEGCGRCQPVVAVIPVFAEASLANSMDEVVLHDMVSKIALLLITSPARFVLRPWKAFSSGRSTKERCCTRSRTGASSTTASLACEVVRRLLITTAPSSFQYQKTSSSGVSIVTSWSLRRPLETAI